MRPGKQPISTLKITYLGVKNVKICFTRVLNTHLVLPQIDRKSYADLGLLESIPPLTTDGNKNYKNVVMSMTTCEWRRAYSHTQPIEYNTVARGDLSLFIPPTTHTNPSMANYDPNHNPSSDPAFDKAPFSGEENAEE